MAEPVIERRPLPERIEVKIEPTWRTCRIFKITERGLGALVNHAGKLEAGAAKGGFNTSHKKE